MSILFDLLRSCVCAIPDLMSAFDRSIPDGMGAFDHAVLDLVCTFFKSIARARFLVAGRYSLARRFISKDPGGRQSNRQGEHQNGDYQWEAKHLVLSFSNR